MWSLGVVLHRMIVGCFPFNSDIKCRLDLFSKIVSHKLMIPDNVDPQDKNLLECMLEKEGAKRILLEQVVLALKNMI